VKDFNRHLSDDWFDYNVCKSCGTLSIASIPDALGRYYPSDYYSLPSTEDDLARAATHEEYKLELISRFNRGGRLLEIGPGAGGFAYLAKRAGFDVAAVEMDERACAFLRDVVGVRVVQTADPEAPLRASGQFDVISLWHVLEHLARPEAVLEAAAGALAPGGVVVIAVPNPRSIQFALLRRYWAHLDAPRHLALMPSSAIREAAQACGLDTVFETSTDVGGLGWNAFGWQMSLRNLVPGMPAVVARAVTRLMRPVERRGLRGATMTLVLRKAVRG